MSLTHEQPVNGHNGHELRNLAPFRPVTVRSSLDQAVPDPVEQTQPLSPLAGPDTNHSERQPVAPPPAAAPTPAPPAPRTEEPPPPAEPTLPSFPLRGLEWLGLAMTVAMAATGQIMFWHRFFGGGPGALLGAIGVAAAFEMLMIGGTDKGMQRKAEQAPGWRWLVAGGAVASLVAATVQLLHWDIQMGVPFAAASLLGWAVHTVSGWSTAQRYINERSSYDAEMARRRRKAESRADAEYERYMADVETQQQAVQRAVDTVTPTEPKPEKPAKAASGKKTTPAKSTGRKAAAAPELTPALAREWSDANDGATASQVIAHFKQQGYQLKEPRTVRRWLNDR